MLLTYARAFTVASASIEFSRGQIHGLIMVGRTDPINDNDSESAAVKLGLDLMRDLCKQIPSLNPVCHQVDRIAGKLAGGVTPLVLYTELEGLQNRVMDELRGHYYYPVTATNAQLYENERPFGDKVYAAYPSARLELVDAARCLIFGQGTACAFHLTRALEVALRCFSQKLKIEFKPSWDGYFSAIQKALNKPHKDKSTFEKRQESQYREILGDLMSVKLAWRNPTMHVERRYAHHEALQILMACNVLMERLANSGVHERNRISSANTPAPLDNHADSKESI